MTAKQSIYLNPIDAHKLESLGLITYEGDRILPRCELYRAYFKKQLDVAEFEYKLLQKRA